MARAPISGGPGSGSNRRITISAPQAGSNVNVNSAAGRSFVLDFDTSATAVTYDRAGTNLQLLFENGGSVTLVNYFAVGDRPLPNFELSDGSVVSGNDFLTANASDLDLATASGPRAPAAPRGSGVGEYRGELGDLIDGVERLGMLGTNVLDWSNATPFGEMYEPPLEEDGTFFLGTIGSGPGGPTVNESGLPNGSNPGEGLDTGWQTFDLEPGYTIIGLENGGSITLQGQYGTLTITRLEGDSYEYRYELHSPHYSGKGNDGAGIEVDAEVISVPVTDGINNGSINIAIDIVDDIPWKVEVEKSDDPVYSGYEFTGDWDVEYGADGAGGLQIRVQLRDDNGDPIPGKEAVIPVTIGQQTKIVVDGKDYGTIEFKQDGTYVFKPAPNTEANLGVILGAIDGDGDLVEQGGGNGLTFEIKKPPIGSLVLGEKADEWFNESHLKEGTLPNTEQLTKEIALPDGYTVDTGDGRWTEVKDDKGNVTHYTLETDHGTLTYYPPREASGDSPYQPPRLTYTLDHAAQHGDSDVFYDTSAGKIILKDPAGNSYEADTKFKINDDQPVVTFSAGDEDNSASVESGHDLTGAWSSVFGADGPAKDGSLSVTVKVDGKEATFPVTVGKEVEVVVDGKNYGKITFGDDGKFVFTPAPNLEVDLELSLTAKDGEGDTVTADSGKINISVSKPQGPGGLFPKDDTPISESNLPNGTDPDPDALGKEIEIPDGFFVDPTGPDWVKQPDGTYVKEGENGKLIYDEKDNSLKYELDEPHDHKNPGKDIENEVFDDIVLKDKEGNTYPGNKVEIPLEDDVPTVNVDFDSKTVDQDGSLGGDIDYDFGADGPNEDDPLQIIVTTPDGEEIVIKVENKEGEQKFPVTDSKGNEYGEITVDLKPDPDGNGGKGHFEFKPNPDKGGTDLEFEFGAKDGDGDQSKSPGDTISIIDPTGPGINSLESENPLNEAHLPGGTDEGNSSQLTQNVNLPDGYTVDTTQNGWVQDAATGGWKLTGKYGYLSCDSSGGNLTYTLTDRAPHTGEGRDTLQDVFDEITIKDADGKEHKLPGKITIADDEPVVDFGAGNAGNSIGSGQTYEGTWDAKFGADGEKTGGGLAVKVTLDGKSVLLPITKDTPLDIIIDGKNYGKLTLLDNGKYTFESSKNSGGKLQFALEATDSEGDTVSSGDGFVIDVKGPEGPGDTLTGKGDPIKESYLPDGTQEGKGDLTQEIDLPKDYTVDTSSGGWVKQPDGTWQLNKPDSPGHLTWNEDDKKLTYTLDDPLDHDGKGRDVGTDVIEGVTVKDKDGNSFEVNVEVKLEDDVPELGLDGNKEVESGDSITGTWDVDFGADGPARDDSITVTIKHPANQDSTEFSFDKEDLPKSFEVKIGDTVYGEVTFKPDGSYEFKASPDLDGNRLDMTVSAKDGDGDVSTSDPIVIGIIDPEGPPISHLTTKDGSAFDEANFPQGTSPDSDALIKYLNLPDGYTVDTSTGGWERELGSDRWILKTPEIRGDDGQLVNGFGKLIYDAKANTLSYQLTGLVFNGPDSDMGYDTAKDIVLKDKNNNTYELDMIVDIKDDKPELDFSGKGDVSSGQVFEGDWSYMFGADGALESGAIVITVTDGKGNTVNYPLAIGSTEEISVGGVRYGTITLGSNGKFVFKAEPNLEGKLSMSMTVSDRDGDSVTSDSPLELTLKKPGIDPGYTIGGGDDEWFSESYLTNGTEAGAAGKFVERELELPKNSNGDLCTPDLSDWRLQADGTYVKQGSYGYLKWNATTQKLTYTLEKTATHSDPDKHGADDVFHEKIKVTLKDKHGNTYTVESEIEIRDDAPDFDFKLAQSNVESGASLTGDLGLMFGADGAAMGNKALAVEVTVEINGQQVSFTVPLNAGSATNLVHNGVNYGTITVNRDYTFSYKASPNLHEKTSEINVNFVATDRDGDVVKSHGDDGTKITIDPPKVTPPGEFGNGPEEWFSESNLTNGTAPDTGALTKDIKIPDGFSIDVSSGWVKQGGASSNIWVKNGSNGTLTYDKEANTLTYTLKSNAAHTDPNKSGADDLFTDSLNVIFKDANDNTFSSKAEIAIRDDAPTTEFHATNGDTPADNYTVDSGTVSTGTIEVKAGADGQKSVTIGLANGTAVDVTGATEQNPVLIQGQGGTLKVWNDNGVLKYEYKAKGNSDLSADTVRDQFTVTVTDGDGDRATDNLTMNVDKKGMGDHEFDKTGGGAHVDEAGLTGGSNAGTGHVSDWKELVMEKGIVSIQTGTFESTDENGKPDGLGTFEVKFENGKYYYSFTLKNPYSHNPDDQGREEALNATRGKVTVTYEDGNTGDGILFGTIKDDMPDVEFKAQTGDTEADVYTIASGASSAGSVDIIAGADGLGSITITAPGGSPVAVNPAATQQSPQVVQGSGGTLSLWYENGSLKYSYKAKTNDQLNDTRTTDRFVVTVTDNDGDRVTDSLTMQVDKETIPPYKPISGGAHVDEAGLAGGSTEGTGHVSDWNEITGLPAGIKDISFKTNGNGDYGTFELKLENGKYYYRYTLKKNYEHGGPGKDVALEADDAEIVITYADGNKGDGSLVASITDDVPAVEVIAGTGDQPDDTYTIGSGSSSGGEFEIQGGADGLKTVSVSLGAITEDVTNATQANPKVIQGEGGTLTIWNDNGTYKYTYQAKQNTQFPSGTDRYTDQFVITVTDGDNDSASDNLNLTVTRETTPDQTIGTGALADEAGLTGGSSEGTGHVSAWKAVTLPSGMASIEEGSYTGTYGTFVVRLNSTSGEYEYQYTLNKTYTHTVAGQRDVAEGADEVKVPYYDANGNQGNAIFKADIQDDMPSLEIKGDVGDTAADNYVVGAGLKSTGTFEITEGADGLKSLTVNGTTVAKTAGQNTPVTIGGINGGVLKVWYDGNNFRYDFTANDRASFKGLDINNIMNQIAVIVTDNDGDTVSANMSVKVDVENTAPVAGQETGTIHEDNEHTFSGNVLGRATDADNDSLVVVMPDGKTEQTITTQYGSVTIKADGSYTYTVDDKNPLVEEFFNGTDNATSKLEDSFTYTIDDGYGGKVQGVVKLEVTNSQLKTAPPTTDPDNNEVIGGGGNDVIVGDAVGAGTLEDPLHMAYNICIVLDNSNSMYRDYGSGPVMPGVKEALKELAKLLCEQSDGEFTHINLSLISFNSGSAVLFEKDNLTAKDIDDLIATIDQVKEDTTTNKGQGTNYESAFKQTELWLSQQPKSDEFKTGETTTYQNYVYFMTDGSPTGAIPDTWRHTDGAIVYPELDLNAWQVGMADQIKSANGYDAKLDGDGNLWTKLTTESDWTLRNSIFDIFKSAPTDPHTSQKALDSFNSMVDKYNTNVHGIGVNLEAAGANQLNKFDNTNGASNYDISVEGWEKALAKELGESGDMFYQHEATKNTAIDAGEGYNIVFGDALTADWLLTDTSWSGTNYDGRGLVAKQSFAIIKAYVMEKLLTDANGDPLKDPDDKRINDAMRRFIEANIFKFGGSEDGRGNNDTIQGSDEGNIMFGQTGDDIIKGGAGNDLIIGGSGNDTLTGGGGADIFLVNPNEGNDSITDFNKAEGDIVVKVGTGTFGTISGVGADGIREVADLQHGHDIRLADGANHLLVGAGFNSSKIEVDGYKYDNVLEGGSGDDVIFGGAGNNLLIGGAGNDHIVGGPGNDVIDGGAGNDFIHGGLGNDTIFGGSGENTIFGGAGADMFGWKKDASGGKDQIMDFSTGDQDKLNFGELLDNGETLDTFLGSNIDDLSLDTMNNTLNFTIKDGAYTKDVEVHFDGSDTQFSDMVTAYNNAGSDTSAAQEVLNNFLLSISTN